MLRKNVELEPRETLICKALAWQLYITENFTSHEEC